MQNYFNYFTEIEQLFQQRRGSLLMLSTLDWALIETWREAGIPLEAVLRGIDTAFDKHDAKTLSSTRRVRKVNGLAWCSQAILEAVEQANEAAIGTSRQPAAEAVESGFEAARIAAYLTSNAQFLATAQLAPPADTIGLEVAQRLRELAAALRIEPARPSEDSPLSLEELDRTLTVLEEKLFAALLTAAPER
ncbi:MAG TPA: hypothetical protein VNW54_15350, partial [Granulicella sp.]|nr:hypothetical protein [Granulicella sp.]